MLAAALLLSLASTTSSQPDVVLIVVDDLGWADLSCMPDGRHDTPAIDTLARQGALFTQATANGPNCAPARACLMTGQWTPRHGIFTVGSAKRGKAANRCMEPPTNTTTLRTIDEGGALTIADHLRGAGYKTIHVGKWHLGDDPRAHGFDVNIGGIARGSPRSYFSPYKNKALDDGPDGELLTDRLTDEAIAHLKAPSDAPRFVYLSLYAVHAPFQASPEAIDAAMQAHPDWSRRQAIYDCMVRRTDGAIGRVLQHVDDDAVVVLCSDHGGVGRVAHNGHLRGCKGQLFEGGIRTPLLISAPGIAPGTVLHTPVSLHDLAPTLLQYTGAQPDPQHDGRSLVDLLEGRDPGTDAPPQFWHFPGYLEAGAAVDGVWRTTPVSVVRVGHWKLLEFLETGETQLYDLELDPSESHNLADELPIARDAMLGLLRAWRHETDAPMPTLKPNTLPSA